MTSNIVPISRSKTNSLRLLRFTQELIQKPSVTPNDGGCIPWLIEQLEPMGFQCQLFKLNGITNLIAQIGEGSKSLAFLGHTDVVPEGDSEQWLFPPFSAQFHNNHIYGRGAADMKSGIACMLDATKQYLESGFDFSEGKFYWLITSDEEGEAEYGTRAIIEYLKQESIQLDACLVGEPTAQKQTGDTIKIGRRGAISGSLKLLGKVGHVAYPHHIKNPVHQMGNVIQSLTSIEWDEGSIDFPGTSLQITHIDSGDFTDNVSPKFCEIHFNIRYSHHWCEKTLNDIIENILESQAVSYQLTWERPCAPYMTHHLNYEQSLLPVLEKSVFKSTGHYPKLSTSGGTSDGRFAATLGCEVYELGVCNSTIHQYNECVSVNDLVSLRDIYSSILEQYFN
ncbi:succinyl-diaminopimelate desuccinylase [Pleionea sediminis]|uniref:succinyl-diaminopimelate desuccinylase n=1 Tax=Pleionea sediminis TaxID=2569479 RepID=UPI0011851D05|nr:succinyl-diaminopimelate desuccinylase [Pleionea sediminis]